MGRVSLDDAGLLLAGQLQGRFDLAFSAQQVAESGRTEHSM